jgi:hypothetical protein
LPIISYHYYAETHGNRHVSLHPISMHKNMKWPPNVSMPNVSAHIHSFGFPLFIDLESI